MGTAFVRISSLQSPYWSIKSLGCKGLPGSVRKTNQFRKIRVTPRTGKDRQKWPLERSVQCPCMLQKALSGIPQRLAFTELWQACSKVCWACLEASAAQNVTQKPSRLAGGDTFETAASSAGARLAGISRSSWLESALSSFNVLLKGENILISTLPGLHGTGLLPW